MDGWGRVWRRIRARGSSPLARLFEQVVGDERVAPRGGGVGRLLHELVGAAEDEGLIGDEHAEHLHAVGRGPRGGRDVGHPGRLDRRPVPRLLPPPARAASRRRQEGGSRKQAPLIGGCMGPYLRGTRNTRPSSSSEGAAAGSGSAPGEGRGGGSGGAGIGGWHGKVVVWVAGGTARAAVAECEAADGSERGGTRRRRREAKGVAV
jgi:hypothetical protein